MSSSSRRLPAKKSRASNKLLRHSRLEALEDRRLLTALVVTTNGDAITHGGISLRDAIATANLDSENGVSDTITFAAALSGLAITLDRGDLELGQHGAGSGTITIDGGGTITVNGNNASSVFVVDSGVQAMLTGLTISDGHAGRGGGIANFGALTVSNSTLVGNSVSGNNDEGGGIFNSGTLTVGNSTLVGNSISSLGGNGAGIFNEGGLTVSNSTFSGNTTCAGSTGGAIFNDAGTLTVSNSTLSGNSASAAGGIGNSLNGSATLLNTIVAGNTATTADPDLRGAFSANSTFNLIGNGTGMTGIGNTVAGNQVGTAASPIQPLLGTLANNGGPTRTLALLSGSPAIDAGGALTTLSAPIGSGDLTIAVTNAAAIASTPGNYAIQIDDEEMLVTGVNPANNTLTLQRAYNGTTATSHNSGAGVYLLTDQRGYFRVGTPDVGAYEYGNSLLVTTLSDAVSHAGESLRDAIAQANADARNGLSDTIDFASYLDGQTLTLAQGQLELGQGGSGTGTITINGGDPITISGASASRVFQVDAGTNAILAGLTISSGAADYGAGIDDFGTLTVSDLSLTGNKATQEGGGLFVNVGGMATVSNSTFATNGASTYGGGVSNRGTLTIGNSTLAENSTAGYGGALFDGGTATVSDTTLSGNFAANLGGGIYSISTLTLLSTIVASNNTAMDDPDIAGTAQPGSSYNLIGNGAGLSGVTNGATGNQIGTAAELEGLADNGGPTKTMGIASISQAVNAAGALTTLDVAISSSATSIPVGLASAIASTPGSYVIQIDNEQMLVTGVNLTNNTLTVQRGYGGTSAASHAANAGVALALDQRGLPRGASPDIGAYQYQFGNALVVTTLSDAVSHTGVSLRDAIAQANSDSRQGLSDTITFAVSLTQEPQLTIVLTQGPLELGQGGAGSGAISINGEDGIGTNSPPPNITIDGNYASRLFQVDSGVQANLVNLYFNFGDATADGENGDGSGIDNSGTLTVSASFFLQNGNASASIGVGGAIYNTGILVVGSSTIKNCSSTSGGGIYNDAGTLIVNDGTTIEGCVSGTTGGGITNSNGRLTMLSSTLSGNSAAGSGGGIYSSGTATISSSTIVGNVTDGTFSDGGGIFNSGSLTLGDSTLTSNYTSLASYGGGIYNIGSLIVSSSTITGNTSVVAGGGIYNLTGSLTLLSTIVAGNAPTGNAPDVDGVVQANSDYNLIGDGTDTAGIADGSNNNQIGTAASPIDPDFGSFGNNGGSTDTESLLSGSPAIDAGGAVTTITSAVTSGATTIDVGLAAAIANTGSGYIIGIDSELMEVIGGDFANGILTVVRGVDGTSAAAHDAGTAVILGVDQRGDLRTGPPDVGAYEYNGYSVGGSPTPVGFDPNQIRQAYGFNQLSFDGGAVQANGAGETIAVVDAGYDPNIVSDLHNFDVAMGLQDPPSFTQIRTDGSPIDSSNHPDPINSWGTETSLDVEWAHALAPAANILLVETNSQNPADYLPGAATAARQPGVVAVSMSYGVGEFDDSQGGDETSFDSYFTTPAGHAGVTFLAGSGDHGAPGEYPSYSPNVVSVGGTTLTLDSSGNYLSEMAWDSNGGSTGGGISQLEPQPIYQQGVVTQTTAARATPDVSFDADPSTGVAIYDSYDFGTADPWIKIGGTSFSAPAWAAIITIADQDRKLAGGSPLDGPTQTLPYLYDLPSADFHDITLGGNGTNLAAPGYDLVTGLGSPLVNLVVPGLVSGPTSQSPTISGPTIVADQFPQSLTFAGVEAISVSDPNGGSFESVTLALTGSGSLSIDTSGGGIQSGSPADLTISGTLAQVNAALLTLTYAATGTGTSANLVVTANDGSAVSQPLNVSIHVPSVIPNLTVTDKGGVYTGLAYAASVSINNAASLEGIIPSLTYFSGTPATGTPLSGAPVKAGMYTVVANYPGTIDYRSATTSATFTITPASTSVTVSDAGGIYKGSAFAASALVNGSTSLEGVAPTDNYYSGLLATGTPLAAAPSLAGWYTVVASFAGSLDYTASKSNPLTFDIARAPLTLTANHQTKVVGTPDPPLTFAAAGFVGGETAANLTTQPKLSTTAVANSPLGTYPITIGGAVDANYAISFVNGTLTVTPAPIATTTKVKSSISSAVYGQAITFTVTITAASGTTKPSGTVTFQDGGTVLGTASAASGQATFTTSALAIGGHSITAVYGGFASASIVFSGSTSATNPETVTQAATTTTLSSSSSTATSGKSVTFTAKVVPSSPGTGTPTGTVMFLAGTTTLGSVTLSGVTGGAQASFTTSALAVGSDSITAIYGGSVDYKTSTSKAVTEKISQAVKLAVSPAVTPSWQNSSNPLDVLGTGGLIVPADALAVIDYLNNNPAGTPLPPTLPAGSGYLDVLGTGTVVPADALQIINYLNLHSAATPALVTAAVAPVSGSTAAISSGTASSLANATSAPAITPAATAVAAALPALESTGTPATSVSSTASLAGTQWQNLATTQSPTSPSWIGPSESQLALATSQQQAVDALFADYSDNTLDE